MRWFLRLLLFLCVFNIVPARSQNFNMEQDRLPISDLNGPWRFHVGDNPEWAKPDFDDSGWKLKKQGEQWDPKTEGSTDGFAWYRFRVRIPSDIAQPSVLVNVNAEVLELFADGRRICAWGSPPPHVRRIIVGSEAVCRLPQGSAGRNVTIAVRGWSEYKEAGLVPVDSRVGSASEVGAWARARLLERYWGASAEQHLILVYLIGTGGLVLYLLRRREREYLWFGIYELFNVLLAGVIIWPRLSDIPEPIYGIVLVLSFSIKDVAWIFFLVRFLKLRQRWPVALALASIPWTLAVVLVPYVAPEWIGAQVSARLLGDAHLLTLVGNVAYDVGILYPLYRATRARVPDAVYLLIAFISFRASVFADFAISGLAYLGWDWPYQHSGWFRNLANRPFPLGVWAITEFLTQLALLGILGLRFARSRRDEERMATEMEAARAVQHVLIPAETPSVSGLAIETVYKPAGEVGGDFFQVVALVGGGALVVIGDVSGKGMPAAMTVSLLVGTFRTLAESLDSPGELLSRMNHHAHAHSQGGFTTCLIARVDPDGACALANAGHLPPWLNGREVPVESGLPLGLVANTSYAETTLQLSADDRLSFMTDGVVEARAASGELFGFERAANLAGQAAISIADAAQQFGQEDDITVLTLTVAPAAVLA